MRGWRGGSWGPGTPRTPEVHLGRAQSLSQEPGRQEEKRALSRSCHVAAEPC